MNAVNRSMTVHYQSRLSGVHCPYFMRFGLTLALALMMVGGGIMHFVAPRAYARTVPSFLPGPLMLVWVSGVFEILGGAGLLIPSTRLWAAWGLILLFLAIFPANVNMAVKRIGFGKKSPPAWALWARLPFQAVFIAWAWWVGVRPS